MNRPRREDEGTRTITRYEQRMYAAQIKASPYRDEMCNESGSAFEHYVRTDRSGARPVPPALLDTWIDRGWLVRVEVPTWTPPDPVPCVVLDPFNGAATTGLVALQYRRSYIGIDINPDYLEISRTRLRGLTAALPLEFAA